MDFKGCDDRGLFCWIGDFAGYTFQTAFIDSEIEEHGTPIKNILRDDTKYGIILIEGRCRVVTVGKVVAADHE